ncbi:MULTISPECIES: NAD-dependent epimerase/dehydratase family protein [unclassified Burkholderia]|uniref:NAD-dependent epimerase/dehydratase family protein n=1 Tax=unclassified Burkholderia TaxID=2613784 RepID=UPI000F57E36F|nr:MULTISPECIES: NAD-dependent epimerase/dehydratase family protein [unclassified Burkholderia]RQR35116.1 NAD-dependent epimerase/dehydratase family protein [Burkholderia sp. Bp9131]RQR69013.1 NAD-dependent epimerase/dehydratase family protein [Burkholderia sp. Bp9015]RQS04282.1 NAD-dependent epimerase/dehydratase family protein [Burkholderia sp. Bp8991]RQS29796.1 NAD-dependent epimerase/dehydratase family protein [Burkholderia sp. Bp8995]RQS47892.1 NAD-dependent epimerase/dehydratase family p
MKGIKVFVTGAAGYIGGSVAARLVSEGHVVTGLARNGEKAATLAAAGILPVIGTLDDTALLHAFASDADCVINAASSDHRASVETIVAALSGSGKTFLHTSGTSVIADDAQGAHGDAPVFDEATPVVAPAKPERRAIDQLVMSAATLGIRSAVICNSMIYGDGLGIRRDSAQLPLLAAIAREAGAVRVIGKGLNRWSNVHVEDVADLYVRAMRHAAPGALYFAENGEASFADIGAALAARLGLPSVVEWDIAEAEQVLGHSRAHFSLASNSRVKAVRARQELGWAPQHGAMQDWIRHDMPIAA